MRNDTGKQVAQVELQTDEWLYTQIVYILGLWYNRALVAVETNFSTFPGRMLEKWGYSNLYVREKMEGRRRIQAGFGYQTNSSTRPVMLRMLWSIVHDSPDCICSEELVEEMTTFAYNEDKRPEALPDKHDDHVMAAAIAYMVRDQEPREWGFKPDKKAVWHKDQYEDYYAAPPEVQAELLREWGNPF